MVRPVNERPRPAARRKAASETGGDAAWFGLRRELDDLPVVATFTIDGEPMSKARPRLGGNGNTYTPEATKNAEAKIRDLFSISNPRHKPAAIEDPLRYGVTALFFHASRQRRDVDNMLKLVLDGLNEVAWEDDTMVVEVSGRKTTVPKGQERTEVMVYEVSGANTGPTRPCAHCGGSFRVYESTKSNTKFCSTDCRRAATTQCNRVCEACGERFESAHPRKFCSDECKHSAGHVVEPCANCGESVDRFRSQAKQGRPFCTAECREDYWRRNRATTAQGVCSDCGGSTSRKCYERCRSCAIKKRRKDTA